MVIHGTEVGNFQVIELHMISFPVWKYHLMIDMIFFPLDQIRQLACLKEVKGQILLQSVQTNREKAQLKGKQV
jgi:hypothetical protein